MILIIGLGNPGQKFQKTRHNIGKTVVSSLQLTFGFPEFKFKKKFKAFISQGNFIGKRIIIALPETFMNLSGKTVKALAINYRLPATNIWVVHDDIDLPLGKIRIVKNRGAAGHKGVESIIKELRTPNKSLQDYTEQAKNFIRFRIGIKPQTGKPKNLEKFVLQRFTNKEEEIIKEVIKKTCEAIKIALEEILENAMQKYNQ